MGFAFSMFGGGASTANAGQAAAAVGIPIQSSVYGRPLTLVHGTGRVGGNLIEYTNFQVIWVSSSGGGGGKGGVAGGGGGKGGGGGGITYNYYATIHIGLADGPITAVNSMWKSQTNVSAQSDGWGPIGGSFVQPPFFSAYPYAGLAYVFQLNYPLGSSPNLPNFNWEIAGWDASLIMAYPLGSPQAGYGELISYINANGCSPFEAIQALVAAGTITTNGSTAVTPPLPPYTPGSGASFSPTFTPVPGEGTGGDTFYTTYISGVTVLSGGSGYHAGATISAQFLDANGTLQRNFGYVFTPTIVGGVIQSVAVTVVGISVDGFLDWPTVTFTVTDAGPTPVPSAPPNPLATMPDADPSLVVLDLLCNPYNGVGYPPNLIGGQQIQYENRTIPASSPYQITVNNATSYAYNVNVLGPSDLMTCVAGSPASGQYSYDETTGIYTFAPADAGGAVQIRYVSLTGFSDFQAFAFASNLLVSPVYDSQTSCSSMIDDICKACFASLTMSGGFINLVPRSTVDVSANGYSWNIPPLLFLLNDDDFMQPQGTTGAQTAGNSDDPLLVSRARPADQINDVKVEYLDRSNQYAPAIVEVFDQAYIDMFGRRGPSSQSLHLLCYAAAANTSAQFQLQDQYIMNMHSFTVDVRYGILDLMDIVGVTDLFQGIAQQPVRIVEISENDDGSLSFLAEQYPGNVGTAAEYNLQTGSGYIPDFNVSPGPVNSPVVFAAPPNVASNQGLEMLIALSGANPVWGGCEVWVSSDGNTYRKVGVQLAPTRMGVTTSDLPFGIDPDTIDSFSVNLMQSLSDLLSGTQADADSGNTMCLIRSPLGDEYISYQTATLTSSYNYVLGTYLRRGQWDTNVIDHPVGSLFVRVASDNLFAIPYQATDIGSTLYLKFPSFNIYQGGIEDLAAVEAYQIIVQAPPPPPDVTSFSVTQSGDSVVFKWEAVNYPLIGLAGYYIGYAPIGTTDWAQFRMLTKAQGGNGTEMTNADVPPGTWVFGIRAANVANTSGNAIGLSPHITTAELTVVNNNDIIDETERAPGWQGFLYGFVPDFRGALVPANTRTVGSYVTLCVPQPSALSINAAAPVAFQTAISVRVTYVSEGGETQASAASTLSNATDFAVQVASPPPYTGAVGYNVYASVSGGSETLQNNSPIALGTTWMQTQALNTSSNLVPDYNTSGDAIFTKFVPDPVSYAQYIAPVVDVGYDEQVRLLYSASGMAGPLQGGNINTQLNYLIDSWLSTGSDQNTFIPWSIGTRDLRYVRTMLQYNGIAANQVGYVTEFTPKIDQVPTLTESDNAVIAPGGSDIVFGHTYNQPPFVNPTVVGAVPRYATSSNITVTGCTIHVWDFTGADVGGTVNWSASGE